MPSIGKSLAYNKFQDSKVGSKLSSWQTIYLIIDDGGGVVCRADSFGLILEVFPKCGIAADPTSHDKGVTCKYTGCSTPPTLLIHSYKYFQSSSFGLLREYFASLPES